MVLLFSSGKREVYKQFILQVLCYPKCYLLQDVPYRLDLVEEKFVEKPGELEGKRAGIVFVEDVKRGDRVEATFFPLRLARIEKATKFAGKLLLRLRLGEYVYYDEEVMRQYKAPAATEGITPRSWNKLIQGIPGVPQRFVLEIKDEKLDLSVDPGKEHKIREEVEDWKSTIDMVGGCKKLEDKLFYQICGLRRPGNGEVISFKGQDASVYELSPGESVELVLHFYYRDRSGDKKMLEIVTETGYLAMLGRTMIDVYPEQVSGKIEKVRMVVKKQLSEEFTRLTIQEKDSAIPAHPTLTTAELCIRIKPHGVYVGGILVAFFLGSLLNAFTSPGSVSWSWLSEWLWLLKVVGSGMMALAFWLAFSKFPSKGS